MLTHFGTLFVAVPQVPQLTSINTFNTPLTQLIFHKTNVSRGTVRADVMLKRIKLKLLHYLTKIILLYSGKVVSLQRDLETKLNPLNTKIMAKYKITLEFETVVSVNGVRVNSETTRNTQIVEGVFADVAKVMYEHEVNCIKHNNLSKLTKDVYTIFESKDSLQYINEFGCCVTQLYNKLGENASSFLQLIQTSERIK